MIWLIVILVLVILVLVWHISMHADQPAWDESSYRAAVGLHAIRRRLEVAQVKSELRRDAATLRRELRDELGTEKERGRS